MPKPPPGPLELLFMLADSCMAKLSPNAWKVVCYIAAAHLRCQVEWLEQIRNPAGYALRKDIEGKTGMFSSSKEEDRPYRLVSSPDHASEASTARFPVISLSQICKGVCIKRRWRDNGTGLSKSSAAEAITEAIQSGILVRERRTSTRGRDLASLYGIDWDRVQELDWMRRKNLGQPKAPRKSRG